MEMKWKRAFFVLSGIFIVLILGIVILYFSLFLSPTNETQHMNPPNLSNTSTVFTITSHKKELTQLINQQLKNKKDGNISYSVSLQDHVQLKGNIKILSGSIPFIMQFDPKVTPSGQISLIEKSFQLGRLYLPEDQVLKFIKNGTTLPKWIVIDPKKKQIDIELNKLPINGTFYLKADTIDLKHDNIKFTIYQK